MARILIAEDEERMRKLLGMLLGNKGHELTLCEDGEQLVEAFDTELHDAVITDLRLPKKNGMEVIEHIKKRSPETPIIVMTAYGSIESAVDAMQAGASDYVTKPFEETRIHLAIETALERRELMKENRVLRTELRSKYAFESIVAESAEMLEVMDLSKQVAGSSSTVMIYGESGTGKELITRAIHEASNRSRAPFVAINCAAIPDNLLESELFGHEKGAFTGASDAKRGKFELADGGTLFLDEIGELALTLQSKVLRALEAQEFERVGGLKSIKTDIRFLAATNRNLAEEVKTGKFREDLFYRLNVFPIVIPPLRDRRTDIIPLVEHFLKRFCREMGKKPPKISREAEEVLLNHRWDGNVRELQNSIERSVILLEGDVLEAKYLHIDTLQRLQSLGATKTISTHGPSLGPSTTSQPVTTASEMDNGDKNKDGVGAQGTKPLSSSPWHPFRIPEIGFSLEEHEKDLLEQALKRTRYNKSKAAKLLGLSRATLRYRLEKFSIKDKDNSKESKEKQPEDNSD